MPPARGGPAAPLRTPLRRRFAAAGDGSAGAKPLFLSLCISTESSFALTYSYISASYTHAALDCTQPFLFVNLHVPSSMPARTTRETLGSRPGASARSCHSFYSVTTRMVQRASFVVSSTPCAASPCPWPQNTLCAAAAPPLCRLARPRPLCRATLPRLQVNIPIFFFYH